MCLHVKVWVSYNLPEDLVTTPAVLESLLNEIKTSPDKF